MRDETELSDRPTIGEESLKFTRLHAEHFPNGILMQFKSLAETLERECVAYIEALCGMWPGATGGRLRRWFVSRRVAMWGGAGSVGEGVRMIAPEHMSFGSRVQIGNGSFFAADGEGVIIVGDRVGFNMNVHINASGGGLIRIGRQCMIGPNVVFRTADHKFSDTHVPMQDQGHVWADIVLEDDVWLGANVVVVGGVTIGRGAVVAAGAVVTRDVPPMTVVGGVPAKAIKRRLTTEM